MTMGSKLIAGNWKMFKGPTRDARVLRRLHARRTASTWCSARRTCRSRSAVGEEWPIYAQNVHWADEGAFTGEISASMLVELGVRGSLVGHSERRLYFGETDETVRLRAEAALEAGLGVIACVGETEARARGRRDGRRAAPPGRRAAACTRRS